MKKATLLLLSVLLLGINTACSDHDDESTPDGPVKDSRQTLVVFMPWASDLQSDFNRNIKAMKQVMAEGVLAQERLVICRANSADQALLLELYRRNGQCVVDTLLCYTDFNMSTRSSITQMLRDAARLAPSPHYSLIIGSHGWGWLPIGRNPLKNTSLAVKGREGPADLYDWFAAEPRTRWFGSIADDWQIEVQTLTDAIADASMYMDYILFDDCYMSSVEVAYDLRHSTDYIIACPTEIMAYGFPYDLCLRYLVGTPDFDQFTTTFIDFYSTNSIPCGTIGVTDCRRLDELAAGMKELHERYGEPSVTQLAEAQAMDGLTPTLFYDLGDYIRHACPEDDALRQQLDELLTQCVPYSGHTPKYYAAKHGSHLIHHFSGITTSAGSRSPFAEGYETTSWYAATH